MTSRLTVQQWARSGQPWVWLNAAAVSVCIVLVGGLLLLIATRGLTHFWPKAVYEVTYVDRDGMRHQLLAQIRERETVTAERIAESGIRLGGSIDEISRTLLKTGNRDLLGQDFRWILDPWIQHQSRPQSAVVLERDEWGVFFGYFSGVRRDGVLVQGNDAWSEFHSMLKEAADLRREIERIQNRSIGRLNFALEKLRLRERQIELDGDAQDAVEGASIAAQRGLLASDYVTLEADLDQLSQALNRNTVLMETAAGATVEIPLARILDAWRPNSMNLLQRVGHFGGKIWEFVATNPREANTEGGVFPAIFGTFMMVLLMTVLVAPMGVVAGVYMKEYARQGPLVSTIRIAVNNLAGVPSIVYGVFGLGFFVYVLGGSIDQLFYEAALPSPTFGTGGLLWASLTLALLTLPVVIVSTEEGLARIPRSVREGSLALGATSWETLWRTILPMASPGILTGLILAVARAAGEVAPLMLVGVVKLAPSLPVDANAPFVHLERKFMHLGFHIYDVGFQSPNVEAARPLVYATALLLVSLILLLNLLAIGIRNRLRSRYEGLET